MPSLEYLLLKVCCNDNMVGEKGHKSIAEAMKKLPNLVSLTLATSGSQVTDEFTFPVSEALSRMTNLHTLTLGYYENHLTDRGTVHISNALACLKSLACLRLNICGYDSLSINDL
jgi:hypothetical protein